MNIFWRKQKSLTLAEILIAVCVLLVAVSSILLAYANCFILIDSVKNTNIATNAAEGMIESIRNTPFARLITDPADLDRCDCDTFYCSGCTFIVKGMSQNRGVMYIENMYGDEESSRLLGITVSVCWRQKGRLIGEDSNLNGVLDAGEDKNGNGKIDSQVELKTRMAVRN